jgi:hypothetical protein
MDHRIQSPNPDEPIEINLRDPVVAGFWAWFLPGAGHLYQRRYGKGILFMTCILSTWFFGLWIGGGRVVYASWTETDKRLQYICQVGVGLPALPALVQGYRVTIADKLPLMDGFMAPPEQPMRPGQWDDLARIHRDLGPRWHIGELYTMVAGLLNILVIYDAAAGPVFASPKKEEEPDGDQGSTDGDQGSEN